MPHLQKIILKQKNQVRKFADGHYPYCKNSKTTEMRVQYVHIDNSSSDNKV